MTPASFIRPRRPGAAAWGTSLPIRAVASTVAVLALMLLSGCAPSVAFAGSERNGRVAGRTAVDPAALRARADSLVSSDSIAASLPLYRRVVEAWPDSVRVVYRLGQVLLYLGEPEESLARFRFALDREYRRTSALYNTAVALSQLGRMDEAFATLDEMMAAGFRNRFGLLTDDDLEILWADPRWRGFIGRVWGTGDHPELSAPVQRVRIQDDVRIPMRDGVALRAHVVVPEGDGPFPTVLVRTPYGRSFQFGNRIHWAARGYVLVAQDVRGRGDSEGEFDPWMNERADGWDTLEWITQQPWSDGRVGMIGASYVAQVQWLAAAGRHPALKAMIPLVSGTDPFFDTPWDHGILKLGLLDWAYDITHPDGEEPSGDPARLREVPLADADLEYTGVDLPIWNRWVARDVPADWDDAAFLDRITTPGPDLPAVLHVSGWWDVESIATDRNWRTLAGAGHGDQWLLYGPWAHNDFIEPPPLARGEVEFGEAAALDYLTYWVRFFDHTLKRRRVGQESAPRVMAYLIGENRWLTGDSWPLPSTRPLDLFLSAGTAESARGALHEASPPAPSQRSFVQSPSSTPIREDPSFSASVVYPGGAVDDDDQLAWVTPPLRDTLRVVGPVELSLTFSSDAPDADFYALLVSVAPDGTAHALAQPGKVRGSFHGGWTAPRALEPDRPYPISFPLPPVGYALPAGHRLGLVIRGDWMPRFALNPHTAPGAAFAPRPARLTVHHGGASPSMLRIHVIE